MVSPESLASVPLTSLHILVFEEGASLRHFGDSCFMTKSL